MQDDFTETTYHPSEGAAHARLETLGCQWGEALRTSLISPPNADRSTRLLKVWVEPFRIEGRRRADETTTRFLEERM